MIKTKNKPKFCPHCGHEFLYVDWYESTQQWSAYCICCEGRKDFDKIILGAELI